MTNLSKYFDHTNLKPDATREMITKLCDEAKEYNLFSVCVNPCYVSMCKKLLINTDVKVCTVIGFPLGSNTTAVKVFEAKKAIEDGADEIDMVINVAALKDNDYDFVLNDIKKVVNEAKNKALVKVIIETCLLTDEQKIKASELCVEAGADFVKTSTGFSTGGATEEDIKLIKSTVKDKCLIKASGGIRTYEDTVKMINAGANRIGASASVSILKEIK